MVASLGTSLGGTSQGTTPRFSLGESKASGGETRPLPAIS